MDIVVVLYYIVAEGYLHEVIGGLALNWMLADMSMPRSDHRATNLWRYDRKKPRSIAAAEGKFY